MSLGYADKLKRKKNVGGQLGAPEFIDSVDEIENKMAQVANLVSDKDAKVVAFTGAGISTAIGIPDFRGPSGIWTLRSKKKPVPPLKTRFEYALPSFTHMALVALLRAGKLTHVCSQNVDSLHLRSGLPRALLAELHGNCFAERCSVCGREYLRDFEIDTVGFKKTGRSCCHPGCGGPIIDNTLDWDSKLPDDELQAAIDHADAASVCLVLGTSLQIAPANELPLITRDAGGKIVIVNLQKTPRDRQAHLIIRARVDFCMALLLQHLHLKPPPYVRTDCAIISHSVHWKRSNHCDPQEIQRPAFSTSEDSLQVWSFTLSVHSRHGDECPMPMVESVSLRLPPDLAKEYIRQQPSPLLESNDSNTCEKADSHTGSAGLDVLHETAIEEGPAPFRFNCSCLCLPVSLSRVCCILELHLCSWADEDRRSVMLEHIIEAKLDMKPDTLNKSSESFGTSNVKKQDDEAFTTWQAAGALPLEKDTESSTLHSNDMVHHNETHNADKAEGKLLDNAKSALGSIKVEENGPECSVGSGVNQVIKCHQQEAHPVAGNVSSLIQPHHVGCHPTPWSMYHFVTQVKQYSETDIIANYKADPPAEKKPEPRAKKQKTGEEKVGFTKRQPAPSIGVRSSARNKR